MDGVPLGFDLNAYRKLLVVDDKNLSTRRVTDKACFWDELVKSVADEWKAACNPDDANERLTLIYTDWTNRIETARVSNVS